MQEYKSKQIYIKKYDYPFDTVKEIINNEEIINQILNNDDVRIKKFLGSDYLIKDSGFILYYSNILNYSFLIIDIKKKDFIYSIRFKISHLNGNELKNEFYYIITTTRNTIENMPIVEYAIEYVSELALEEFEKYIKLSLMTKLIKKICSKFNSIIKDKKNNINSLKNLIINHSLTIKKNYKDVFNFFYDFNNIVKCLKADKLWKVITKENNNKYKDSYIIIINKDYKVHYHVTSIKEINGEKIEIVFNKTNNCFRLLNNIIKFTFFQIDKNLCLFVYETYLPINISASNYEDISHYTHYCMKMAKKYIENNK